MHSADNEIKWWITAAVDNSNSRQRWAKIGYELRICHAAKGTHVQTYLRNFLGYILFQLTVSLVFVCIMVKEVQTPKISE
jgi:hypothetical protein